MDMFLIEGGHPLSGRTRVNGSKNAALPMMAASLLTDGPLVLRDVPDLVDIRLLAQVLERLGVRSEYTAESRQWQLTCADAEPAIAPYDLVRRMRASVCVLGPLVARRKRACVSLPGGCNIGHRPIDLHLKGLRALGADIRVERGYVVADAARLRGANIFLGGPFGSTVTGTCNVMMAATLAEGRTVIESAACEPDVEQLGQLLNAMGAQISGLGTPCLTIDGVDRLHPATMTIIPDRIEAATLLMGAIITRGRMELENVNPGHLSSVLDKLRELGAAMHVGETSITVEPSDRLQAADSIALPYPGIPTDVLAQLTALMTTIPGISVATDKVFPDRFMHVPELMRMGASIRREGPSAIIAGGTRLSGASVMASDLRASAALVLAAMAAEGESTIRRIYHLDRGYERLEDKLNALGARIRRVDDQSGVDKTALPDGFVDATEGEPSRKAA